MVPPIMAMSGLNKLFPVASEQHKKHTQVILNTSPDETSLR